MQKTYSVELPIIIATRINIKAENPDDAEDFVDKLLDDDTLIENYLVPLFYNKDEIAIACKSCDRDYYTEETDEPVTFKNQNRILN